MGAMPFWLVLLPPFYESAKARKNRDVLEDNFIVQILGKIAH